MQAIPEQLAQNLPPGAVRLESLVTQLSPHEVLLGDGSTVAASGVVVATDPWTAHRLLPDLGPAPEARGVTTVYHSAPVWPAAEPGRPSTLVTDTDGSPVTNTIVLSSAAPSYAPEGRALVSTSLLLERDHSVDARKEGLLDVLAELHGQDASEWEELATYEIPFALPAMPAPHDFRRPVRVRSGDGEVFVTGDHRDSSSIQGALVSGRRAAGAVLASALTRGS
jgi:protoporphyrinogen oxidase